MDRSVLQYANCLLGYGSIFKPLILELKRNEVICTVQVRVRAFIIAQRTQSIIVWRVARI